MRTRVAGFWVASVLAACTPEQGPLPIVGTLERDRVELIAEANEPIVEIAVVEGDEIGVGQLVLRLDSALQDTRVAQAKANRDRAEQRLAELIRGPRSERIMEARARLDGTRENLATERREYDRIASLLERSLVSPSDLDRAHSRRELATAEHEQAQAALTELLEGTTAEELAQAQAALNEAEALHAAALIARQRLTLTSPRNGRVDSLPYELGERPPKGATVAVLLADSAPYARVYIPEPLRARVTPGLRAEVRVDGREEVFAARVRYVAADAAFTPYYALTQRDRARLAFVAEIDLDEAAADLPTGVPIEVDFPELR